MMAKWFALVVFWVAGVMAGAASMVSVRGTVTDASTGESLIGAAVRVLELEGTGTTTNGYGYFSLALPAGKYTLVVSYVGYKQWEQLVELQAGQLVKVALDLS